MHTLPNRSDWTLNIARPRCYTLVREAPIRFRIPAPADQFLKLIYSRNTALLKCFTENLCAAHSPKVIRMKCNHVRWNMALSEREPGAASHIPSFLELSPKLLAFFFRYDTPKGKWHDVSQVGFGQHLNICPEVVGFLAQGFLSDGFSKLCLQSSFRSITSAEELRAQFFKRREQVRS